MHFVGRPRTFSRSKRTHQRFAPQGQSCDGLFPCSCVGHPISVKRRCCLTATTKCAGFPHIFPDLLHQQKGCSWFARTQVKYLKARRQELGGYLPLRSPAKAWVHECHWVIGLVGPIFLCARSLLSWSCHRMRRPTRCSTKVPISDQGHFILDTLCMFSR